LFNEKKEFFLKLSLFFIKFYANIAVRTFNDYECSAHIPSEILCFFHGTLSVFDINDEGILKCKGNKYECSCCKRSLPK
jgi:hypothetical protein